MRITRDRVGYEYDPAAQPVLTVEPGTTVVFETQDARGGSMFVHPAGELVDLPRPTPGRGNPVTGPLAIAGAEVGDGLTVDILRIETISPGWCGGHAHVHPLAEGRIPRARGRVCDVRDGRVHFSADIELREEPMVGCIATAPEQHAVNCGKPGPWGGNLDHKVIAPGARVYLPVHRTGALLWIGDVHAQQGDGELSGTAVEIAADVTVQVNVRKGLSVRWPWIETADRLIAISASLDFADARRQVVESMMCALEHQLRLEPAEALALISAVGDLRIGQAFGGMEMTLRLEMPRSLGVRPEWRTSLYDR